MMDSLLKAAVVVAVIVGLWLMVQSAWRRMFPDRMEQTGSGCAGWRCQGCTGEHNEDAANDRSESQSGRNCSATTGL